MLCCLMSRPLSYAISCIRWLNLSCFYGLVFTTNLEVKLINPNPSIAQLLSLCRVAQTKQVHERVSDELYEMSKPLARYADDEDLEKMLREREREGDPMLAFIRSKKVVQATQEGRPRKGTCTYEAKISVLVNGILERYGDQNGETSGCSCSCPLTGDLHKLPMLMWVRGRWRKHHGSNMSILLLRVEIEYYSVA